jgi:hypothetical protein
MKWNNIIMMESIRKIDIIIFCITFSYEIVKFIKDRILLFLAGKNIFKNIKDRNILDNHIKSFILSIFILGLYIIISNKINGTMFSIFKTIIIGLSLIYINKIFYTNINGIYENGIINNKYIIWGKIIAYFYFDKVTVTFFIKNKKQIMDITMEIKTENINILNKYLIEKNIDYRNVYEL